ncbi:hypothetical protein LY76DRAFT_163802 [Colletotrichum caudatum]|nr:hypothetical protein LY76DRAFT_163802 [Colletotrichum caudatum]
MRQKSTSRVRLGRFLRGGGITAGSTKPAHPRPRWPYQHRSPGGLAVGRDQRRASRCRHARDDLWPRRSIYQTLGRDGNRNAGESSVPSREEAKVTGEAWSANRDMPGGRILRPWERAIDAPARGETPQRAGRGWSRPPDVCPPRRLRAVWTDGFPWANGSRTPRERREGVGSRFHPIRPGHLTIQQPVCSCAQPSNIVKEINQTGCRSQPRLEMGHHPPAVQRSFATKQVAGPGKHQHA